MGRHRTLEERIGDLEQRIDEMRGRARARRAKKKKKAGTGSSDGRRFSPAWVIRQREKLGLSAADFGRLVGVSGLSIYNWEKGRVRPRAKQLEALASVRGMGVREARQQLASKPPGKSRKRSRKA